MTTVVGIAGGSGLARSWHNSDVWTSYAEEHCRRWTFQCRTLSVRWFCFI